MSSESYLYEINNIDRELKRLREQTRLLNAQKARAMTNLHHYMVSHNLDKVGGVTIEKCTPKGKRAKSKPKTQKKKDAIRLFRDAGIPDPENFYLQFEETQRLLLLENAAISNKKKQSRL